GHARARHALCAAVLLPLLGAPAAAEAPRPRALEGVRVEERIGDKVPLELWFSDTTGRRIQLGALFRDGKPVLLVLAYVRCKMLCSLVLQGTTEAVRTLPLELGRDYRVVMVSIDPAEEAASAEAKRRELLRRSGRP